MRFLSPVRRFVFAAFLMDMCGGAVTIGQIFLGKQLGATPVELGLMGAFGAGAYAGGCMVTGRLSDSFGRKRSLAMACIGVALFTALTPWSTRPWHIIVLSAAFNLAMAFFWPCYQAWMADITVGGRKQFNHNVGMFNIAWTLGLASGPVIAGALWKPDGTLLFWSICAATFVVLADVLSVPQRVEGGGQVDESNKYERVHPLADALLRFAWVASFAGCAVGNLVRYTFPNLGLTIHYSPLAVGTLVAFYHLGQMVTFVAAQNTDRWQNRKWPLVAWQAMSAVGMLLCFGMGSKLVYALGFALAGSAQAVAFVSSQFYTLHGRARGRGRMAGFHEAVVGSGFLVGPLIGGFVAEHASLQAPYVAGAGIYLASIVCGLLIWKPLARGARVSHKAHGA